MTTAYTHPLLSRSVKTVPRFIARFLQIMFAIDGPSKPKILSFATSSTASAALRVAGCMLPPGR
jgi:hypothetical protein